MSQDDILKILSDQPMTQKEIRAILHADSSGISQMLIRLCRKGLVKWEPLERRYRPRGYTRA
jgi:predicted transcriptional regulator